MYYNELAKGTIPFPKKTSNLMQNVKLIKSRISIIDENNTDRWVKRIYCIYHVD